MNRKHLTPDQAVEFALTDVKQLNELLQNGDTRLTHRNEWTIKNRMKRHLNLIQAVQTLKELGFEHRWINTSGTLSFKFPTTNGNRTCEYRPNSGSWSVVKGHSLSSRYKSRDFAQVINKLLGVDEL